MNTSGEGSVVLVLTLEAPLRDHLGDQRLSSRLSFPKASPKNPPEEDRSSESGPQLAEKRRTEEHIVEQSH